MLARQTNRTSRVTDRLDGVEILLVDDSRTYGAALTHRFERFYGISVIHCETLADLTAALEAGADRYAIAMVDLNLPGAPNGEALDLLLAHKVPPIVFTATFSEQMRRAVMEKSVADYVMKNSPAAIDHLVSSVVRLLSNRDIHVLVVDDVASTRELMARHLRTQLFRVTTASGAKEAFAALEANPDISLAVIDYEMPGMSGTELVATIRTYPDLERLRIIGVSSGNGSDLMTKFLKAGANDFVHRPFNMEEFHWRVAQNVHTVLQVRELRELAARDYLTGLYNRRHFFDLGPRLVAAGRAACQPMSMAIMDIDHFKRLNDTYGHEIGDVVLKAVARTLQAACGKKHLIARLGGEEFGVLITGLDIADAKEFCNELRSSIEHTPVATDDGDLKVTISIGLAEIAEIESFDNYLNAADQFLYMAKHAGRNCVISEFDLGSRAVA